MKNWFYIFRRHLNEYATRRQILIRTMPVMHEQASVAESWRRWQFIWNTPKHLENIHEDLLRGSKLIKNAHWNNWMNKEIKCLTLITLIERRSVTSLCHGSKKMCNTTIKSLNTDPAYKTTFALGEPPLIWIETPYTYIHTFIQSI